MSSIIRLFVFAVPVLLLLRWRGLTLHHIWLISAGSIWVQAFTNLWFLRGEFRRNLDLIPENVADTEVVEPAG